MTVVARRQIADYLRRELVGPDPISPYVQANGEEILTSDPPRLRYGAGVLFPQNTMVDTASAATLGEVADVTDAFDAKDETAPDDDLPTSSFRADDAAEAVDETISLTNAFLPSALGLSCLIDVPAQGITISVKAATYRSVSVPYVTKGGDSKTRTYWHREPFTSDLTITHEELVGNTIKKFRKLLAKEPGGKTNLEIHCLSRPYDNATKQNGHRLLTISLVNPLNTHGKAPRNEDCFYQVEMDVRAASGEACFTEYPEHKGIPLDDEERSLSLLYRHQKTFAIGHGCAAEWNQVETGRADRIRSEVMPEFEMKPVVPVELDDVKLRMYDLSDLGDEKQIIPLLEKVCTQYETWINAQQSEMEQLDFPSQHVAAAEVHILKCRECLRRMRRGIELLAKDPQVFRAFRLSNRAMLTQQLHYNLPLRNWSVQGNAHKPAQAILWPDLENPISGKGTWRPFQIAFILINLCSLSGPDDPERDMIDLIWFPTGGGKTEAYLGLTAFAILYRRLIAPTNIGTTVLMRYTLRLLTAQQFERAATLICALEQIRDMDQVTFGVSPITIGLWVGGGVTPNKRVDAVTKYNRLCNGQDRDNPFIILKCPWCGMQMGPVQIGNQLRVMGYSQEANPMTIVFRCKDQNCYFSDPRQLPLIVIDEDIYDNPPTLLIGTVDKFAMIPWEEKARRLFGIGLGGASPPDLVIQDELHLISGPLGSMVGHYETIIQEFCTHRSGTLSIRPKIIASTATISRAAEQCHLLYNCSEKNVFQFPPQCLSAGDTFFAREDREQPGRMYIGVHASALPSHVTAQIRTMAALLQAPMHLEHENERNPYWTLIGYFNSLRELGHAATLIRADIREYLNAMWLRKEIEKPKDGERDLRRFTNSPLELTSRVSNATVPESLQSLQIDYPSTGGARPVDVCLATNMISVGVDVPRLGVMTVIGQPKTTSEYIQATSRVGRSRNGPGLVVVIYNTGKPRDRSHYEHFRSYHASIYRNVEPTSVTPFAAPVRERALHSLMISLVRYLSPSNLFKPQPLPDISTWNRVRQIIRDRVTTVDPQESIGTLQLLERRIAHWSNVIPPRYGDFGPVQDETPLMFPAGSVPSERWESKAWPVQSSMRDVDATCDAHVLSAYP